MSRLLLTLLLFCAGTSAFADRLFIPMDAKGQADHLKAYGIVYAAIAEGMTVDWLLNYRGGSFIINGTGDIAALCRKNGVTVNTLTESESSRIIKKVKASDFNGQVIKLDKVPRIAVYTPLNKEPWDDAVTMVLTYAGIPFDKLYADEVLEGDLSKYDWLHLHHEDFTGQYSKFWVKFHDAAWYQLDQRTMESLAEHHGYKKVSELQVAVVKKIKDFVSQGGNLFAMCTATETMDIALAADGVDISDTPFDGDPPDVFANDKLNYNNCIAFKAFHVVTDPISPFHSDIDYAALDIPEQYDYFTLVKTDAKKDPVTAMLCQDHASTIKGFMGQTTAFREDLLKPGVTVLARNAEVKAGTFPYSGYNSHRVKYIHGTLGKGAWTFYGGHDPESYKHMVGSPPTDLNKFPNSAGYRLILNNLLLPAAKKSLMQIAPAKTESAIIPIAKSVKMYPDVEKNELTLTATEDTASIGNVVITGQNGKEVFHQSYAGSQAVIDLKNLPAGIYEITAGGKDLGRMAKQ